MRSLRFAIASAAFAAALSSTASAGQLSIKDCIDQAVAHSPLLAGTKHEIAAARFDITKKQAGQLPYISSKLKAYEVNGFPASPFSPIDMTEPDFGITGTPKRASNAHWAPVSTQEISLEYPIFSEGSVFGLNNPPPVATATAVLTQAELTSIVNEQKVVLDASTAFLNAASFRDQMETRAQIVALNERLLEIVHENVRLGIMLPQEIEIYQAQFTAARRAEESTRQNAQQFLLQLAQTIGRGADPNIDVDTTQPQMPELPALQQFLDRVMAAHPALRIQQAKVEVAKQQLRVDQATRFPTVKLDTSFAGAEDLDYFNGGSGHRRPTEFLSYITVDIPLWDFGQRRAANSESQEKLESAKSTTAELDLEIRKSIAESSGKIQDYAEEVGARKSDLIKDQKAADLAAAQREQGVVDQLTLLTAQLTAANAKAALESEILLERLEYAELQDLSGGVWRWIQ